MPQQTLLTGRLTLVPLADEHLEWEVELDSDPEVMRYLSGRASSREEVEAGHAQRLTVAQKVDGLGFWIGLVEAEFVGWWTLQPAHGPDQPKDPGVADLGYRLLQRHWRKGLASEGAWELVRYGFDDVRLDRIIAQTYSVNVRSRARDGADRPHLRADLPQLQHLARGGRRGGRSGVRDDARAVGAPCDLGHVHGIAQMRDTHTGDDCRIPEDGRCVREVVEQPHSCA